ncbi:hypothetical protein GS682_04610 [Nostoc sp. B(2019)]|nr:hypothetical protein [Nostoc sp. B(2019)]
MLYLICNNEIAGVTDQQTQLPSGYESIEGPDEVIENLYFDGIEIKVKPPKPSDAHYWDKELSEWVLPRQGGAIAPQTNRWIKFLLAIISTSTYDKIKTFLGANNPAEYTVLVALLNNSDIPGDTREQLLSATLRRVKELMKGSSSPLTSSDVGTINRLLKDELGVSWDISG